MPENRFDLMILGSGPAGLTAALYGQRLGLNVIVFGDIPGGSTYMIQHLANFPGYLEEISGTQFGTMAFQQAQREGAFFTMTRLKKLNHADGVFIGIDADSQQYAASCAIVATGRIPKRLAVANANIRGVHFCSICDGPLYKGQDATLAVVGNDNTAGQHAVSLARIADKVLLISRSDKLSMDAAHKKLIEKQNNIELLLNTEVTGYQGQDVIEGLEVSTTADKARELAIGGIFLAIGWRPNTKMLDLLVEKTSEGYLKADQKFMTSFPGLFTAGDVRETDMWQVLTACADGARAAKYAAEFIEKFSSD
ncbi:MAG: NAD(P)/FAD-dependent oxidoreductase [Deltaproteobacteria bacterium]|nr:NAD(P)/FAD-dependent oxidoreductase [Deltaproteobacteria bacterium]